MATKSDRSLLIDWIQAFTEEAIGDSEPEQNYQKLCDRRLSLNSLYIWQDDIPVSMAGISGATPNGIRINAVYIALRISVRTLATRPSGGTHSLAEGLFLWVSRRIYKPRPCVDAGS